MIDERGELLLTRRLDGELNPGESLELDKLLIRSPEARRAYERSLEIEALAGRALRRVLEDRPALPQAALVTAKDRPAWRRWAGYGAGLAAAVMLTLAGGPLMSSFQPRNDPGPTRAGLGGYTEPAFAPPEITYRNVEPEAILGVVRGPREYRRRIDHDVIGIVDPETQAVYLLEAQTTRDVVRSVRANY
ncbi:MAG: hypothetical protein HRF43_05025 [Phycisphaerae bacterium]|jgi:hypothetical protein